MKVAVFFCACIAATQAGLITYPFGAPTFVRTPTVIHANRLGGNFAYSTLSGHPFINPYGLTYTYPLGLSPSLVAPNLIPGTYLFPGHHHLLPVAPAAGEAPKDPETPVEAPAEPAGEEATPAAEDPAPEVEPEAAPEAAPEETPAEESQPADDNVDESVGEVNNDGADESAAPTDSEAPQSDDFDSVSVDSA